MSRQKERDRSNNASKELADLIEAFKKPITESSMIFLEGKSAEFFVEMISNPPSPSKELRTKILNYLKNQHTV